MFLLINPHELFIFLKSKLFFYFKIMIFPEGTCTNRSCLITFKPGRYDAHFSVLYRMFLYLQFLKYHLHCNLLAVAEVELKNLSSRAGLEQNSSDAAKGM